MKYKTFPYLFVFLLFTSIGFLQAQFFITGDPPANVRWETLQSHHFQFIFPREMEQQAREFAVSFDQAWEKVTSQLSHRPKPIPVVIHPHLSISNGLVSWAPRRMEIYPSSPQSIDPQLWIHQLAIHETRHVAQISKLNQGFTRFLTFLTGEMGTGFAAGMIPPWFYEGDAVFAETAYSTAGRGRSPSFEMKIKAQVNEDKKPFSYDKSLFGSYRDFVPNHYEYGYQLVSYASEKFGHDFWVNTINYTGRNPFVPFAFRQGMKRQKGISPSDLYQLTMQNLISNNSHENNTGLSPNIFSPLKKDYINYYSPKFISDSLVAALKDGPGFIRQIVTINKKGEEKKIHVPGFLSANKISVNAGKITWSETIPDARWGNQSYSVIKVFDIATGKETQLTRRTRYYAPSLSPSGNFIAAIENDILNNCYLVLLDARNGMLINRIQTAIGSFLQFPEWTSENELVMTTLDDKGKHLVTYNKITGEWNHILSAGNYDLSNPSGNSEIILFNSTWGDRDNVYSLDRKTNRLFQLTNAKYGAFEGVLNVATGEIAYSTYSNEGFKLEKKSFEPLLSTPFEPPKTPAIPSFRSLVKEPVVFRQNNEKALGFESKNYSKLAHLFHFHSWAPFYYDFENIDPAGKQEIYPGITLLSQNLLNTSFSQLSYAYKNGRHFTSNTFTYRGFLPVIELGMNYGDEPLVFMGQDAVGLEKLGNDLLNFRTRVYIPVRLTTNRFIRGIIPALQIKYNNSYYHYTIPNEYRRGKTTLDWRLNYYSYLKMSQRDISPRWGSQLRLRYFTSPFETENFGSLFNATVIGYIPGLFNHHSIRLRGDYQKQWRIKYLYRSIVDFPRGFEASRTEILYSFKSDYFFPIIYPDIGIPGIIYLKRIRGSIYYDFAINQYRALNEARTKLVWRKKYYHSTGLEILADYHAFRLIFPFSTGVRVNYLPQFRNFSTELIFNINLGIF